MEKSIPKISPQKVSTSSEVTTSIQHGEKSHSSGVSPVKSPENFEKKVLTKVADIPTASAQHESFETDAVSQDEEEEEFNLRLQSSDEETFEDTVEDVSELKQNKSSAVETYFSDIESSDDSQVYEPKSLKTTSAEAKKAVSIVSKVVDTKGPNKEKSQLDFDPVESEEDFEESRSQEEDSILLPMEDDSLDTETQSKDKTESNERQEAEIGAKVMSDEEDSQMIEGKKEEKKETPSSGAAINNDNQLPVLLKDEKKGAEENISVLEAVDVADSSTLSPTNVELDDISESPEKLCAPEDSDPSVSPIKSPEMMECDDSDDILVPLEKIDGLTNEEPAQNGKKSLEESEKDAVMDVDTDIPSLEEDKVSAEVYEASSESMNVELREAMEVDSDLQQTIEEDDANKNDNTLGDGIESESTHAETSKSPETVENLIQAPDVSIEEEKDASGDDKSLKSPIQSSTSFENAEVSVNVQASTETPIESLKVAERYEVSAEPTESETSTETPVLSSNAVEISEETPDPTESDTPTNISISPLTAEEKSDPMAEDSTGNLKSLNKPENSFETATVTVDIIDKSQENKQYTAGDDESLNKIENIPKADETSTDDKSRKEESIENEECLKNTEQTLETDKTSMEDDEECEDVSTEIEKSKVIAEEHVRAEETAGDVETGESFLDKPETTTVAAENSVELLKSPEKEHDEHSKDTATSSDILLGTDGNTLKAIAANIEDLTGVNEVSKKPNECRADEESDKPDEHISEPAKTLESAQNLERNEKDSTKNEELVVSAEEESKKTAERTTESEKSLKSVPKPGEDSTKAEKSEELDEKVDVACQKEKSLDKSGEDPEKSAELSKKSTNDSPSLMTDEKSLEKPEEAKTNSSVKETVASTLDDGTTKISQPEATVDVQVEKSVAEILPSDSIKPGDATDVKVKPHSKEQSNAKPISIDPDIIEIDDDELEEDQKGEHTTASDKKPSPTKGKEDDPPAEVVTDKLQPEHDKSPSEVAVPIEKTTEKAKTSTKDPAETDNVIESAVPQDVEMVEIIDDKDNFDNLKQPPGDAAMKTGDTTSAQASPEDDESLLVIDTSHKEDNEPEDVDMDTETEQTATSAPTTTDSSSEGSLEVFYDKECVHYECKHGSKNFYRATLFTLNYYKISKKRNKAQYVCEECYDRALSSYEEMCKTLTKKQPLLHGATFKRQEFVEIIDSSEEDDDDDAGDNFKDENALPKDSIELLEAELEGAIRKVMHNVDIQNQLSWTKQILQQRLNNLQEDTEFVSVQLRQLQKKADNMHNSLYQCPKIKIRQLTPLDLNSGRTYNPETESTIPPMGEVLRTSIHVNETYYAVKNKAIASWVPCKVIEAVDNYNPYSKNQKHFKIKFLKSKYPMLKTVSAKHMAFFNPPKVRLPIGTRVIAYFDVTSLSRGKEKMLIPSAFYPGIIAEPLKQSNKFRYLVFYDDGYFQYVYHKDVRLVCQASENVWEDVHHQSREFIHNYLTQYAVNRPMVQTQKGQSMLVDYNGKWIYARVIDVDCSLVQMLFEGQSRSEWIYRGSTRLGPVYKESNNLVQKNQTNTSRLSRRTEPFIRYINGDDSSSSHQSQEPPQQGQPKSGEVRSVAKKSVSKTDNSHQSSQPVPTVRHLNNSTIFVDDDNKPKGKVVYYTARKNLPPRDYEQHICSPTCPFNVTHNLSFYSPLAKPLLSGWERQVFRQKSKKFIVYRGPCGKRLRSMEELHRYLRVTENELNVDNFDFSAETNCLAEYVIESCIVQKKDISNGKEKMPIPCVNYYDNTMPPDCIYSSRRIPTEGVPLNLDKDFLVGCDCEDDCSDKSKCSCWELTYAGAKYGMPNVPNEMVGYQYKRLYEHVPTGIYECNARCKCKANCVNRVVQQPLQSKLQVFKTSNRGWGLRCINDVPRGSFICIYAGHLLNEQKANEGGLDAGDEYFAELDYIEVAEQIKEGYESDVAEPDDEEDLYNPDKEDEDDDEFVVPSESNRNRSFNTRSRSRRSTKNGSDVEHDSQERQVISFEPNKTMGQPDNSTSEKPTIRKLFGKDEACYIMDAKITGNLGRYFNHSCSPNLFVQNVFVDTHDLRFPWVAFFAFTHIRAGTELTWNYNYEVGVVPGKVLYCQCGAPNCRQRLL